jgi:hypothetical protein
MNVYQAALKLRQDYAHVEGFVNYAVEDQAANAYLIYHDALHSLLGLAPEEEFEPIVISIELLLGGQDALPGVSADVLSMALSSLEDEALDDFVEFYTAHFN